jgi:hypothetical protein
MLLCNVNYFMDHFQFIAMEYLFENILNYSLKTCIFTSNKSYTNNKNNDDYLCRILYCKSNPSGSICLTGGTGVEGIQY